MHERVISSHAARQPEHKDTSVQREREVAKQRRNDGLAGFSAGLNDVVVTLISIELTVALLLFTC